MVTDRAYISIMGHLNSRMAKYKRPVASVGIKETTVSREDLPLPVVVYPQMYGTFIGFKSDYQEEINFCRCSKNAILNAIRLRDSFSFHKDKPSNWNLFSRDFPQEILELLIKGSVPMNPEHIDHFKFKDKICHECNDSIPKYRFLHEMYGGLFTQNFGWYIRKQGFDYGMNISSDNSISGMIKSLCPEEILNVMEFDPIELSEEIESKEIPDWFYTDRRSRDRFEATVEEQNTMRKLLRKQNRKVWNILENIVRVKTGYKQIGEGWTNETTLYYLIKKLFPKLEVKRHHYPPFLKGLELDIFIEDLNVGIEYQGLQHYKPVKHWGGETGLEELKVRDRRKKNLCEEAGMRLIYFRHDEDINQILVKKKLGSLK